MASIAPQILTADFADLAGALEVVRSAGANLIHIDVMDGHFVADITVGQPVIRSLRAASGLKLDVHLWVERPERFVEEFIREGADRVSIHPESTPHFYGVLTEIRARGAEAGVALSPGVGVRSV